MENQGPSPPKPGFGFPHRGFPSESGPERFAPPGFDNMGRGHGGQIRGRGRGFPSRQEEQKRGEEEEEKESLSPISRRLSRWSNPSPPPSGLQTDNKKRQDEEPLSDIQTVDMQCINDSDSAILAKEDSISSQGVTSGNETQSEKDVCKEGNSEPNSNTKFNETVKEDISQIDVPDTDLQATVLYQSTSNDSGNTIENSNLNKGRNPSLLETTNDTLREPRIDSDLLKDDLITDVIMSEVHIKPNENMECNKEVPLFSESREVTSAVEEHGHCDTEMSLGRRLPLHEQNVDSPSVGLFKDQRTQNITETTSEKSLEPTFSETTFDLDRHSESLSFDKGSQETEGEHARQDERLSICTKQDQHFDECSDNHQTSSFISTSNELMQDIEKRLPLVDVLENQNNSTNNQVVDFDEMSLEPPPNGMPSQEDLLSDVTPKISEPTEEMHELS